MRRNLDRLVRCDCGREHLGRRGRLCGICRDRERAEGDGPGDLAFDRVQEARVFEGDFYEGERL